MYEQRRTHQHSTFDPNFQTLTRQFIDIIYVIKSACFFKLSESGSFFLYCSEDGVGQLFGGSCEDVSFCSFCVA
jgi:hypothetical protein